MDDRTKLEARLDRRRFLKGAAATGAVAAMGAGVPAFAAKPASDNNASAKSWREKPDPIDEKLISDGGTFDVVVVGGGNAGLFCARAAALNGASVAVIENQAEENYKPGVGTEVGIVNSQYILDQGAPRIDEADFLREYARRSVIRHNPKRASYFVKNSGRIFDWVISFADEKWLAENCHAGSCPPKPTVLLEVSGWKFYYGTAMFRKVGDKNGAQRWPELLEIHYQKAMADGARWFFEHHGETCDVDDSGAVTGLVARRADGTYVRFRARKGVALCAGGFAMNREMVIDILDEIRHEAEARGELELVREGVGFGLPRDGSGIKLGIWAGGHIEIGPRSTMSHGDPGTGVWHLQLDHSGSRFCDEAAGTTLSQPKDSVTTTFMDANWKKVLKMMPPRHMGPDTADTISWPATLGQLDNLKPGPPSEDNQASWGKGLMIRSPLTTGDVYCANTVEELLDYMNCYQGEIRERALSEIERYNGLCEKGVDEDFGKDPRIMKATALRTPPFYGTVAKTDPTGMFGSMSPGLCTTTGLDTDADGHVLDSGFKPIRGLYAAGNNAGGRYIVVYQSPISGISIGMAMTEGYMLGERLADS